MSEDEAQRRCRAARLCRQFPLLFEMLADASIHLTGILLLGPHLTDENHREVLARARYRRKREIEKLVAELAPRADVPARIEPLHVAARPSADHARKMAALCGPVRRLPPGNGRGQAPVGALAERELADESSLSSHPEPEPAPPRPMHYKVEFTAWQRDQGQCTYLDERGRRCRETSMLEYHHSRPGHWEAPRASTTSRCAAGLTTRSQRSETSGAPSWRASGTATREPPRASKPASAAGPAEPRARAPRACARLCQQTRPEAPGRR